jgi:hypothetical protein
MEIHKTTNKQLNDLFNEARQEKPVMNLKEVDQVIKDGKYTPSGGSRGFPYRHEQSHRRMRDCCVLFSGLHGAEGGSGELGTAVDLQQTTLKNAEAPVSESKPLYS